MKNHSILTACVILLASPAGAGGSGNLFDRVPGVKAVRGMFRTRAATRAAVAKEKGEQLAAAVGKARGIVETAEGAARWAPPGHLGEATKQVLERSVGGWMAARKEMVTARRKLARTLRKRDSDRLSAHDAEMQSLDERVKSALGRPEVPAPRTEPQKPRSAGPLPDKYFTDPWRQPSPSFGKWMDPDPYGPYHRNADHALSRAQEGAKRVASLSKEKALHIDLEGAVREVLEVGNSGRMYDHWAAADIYVSDPHSTMNTERSWTVKVVGNGIGSKLSYGMSGSLSAKRHDIDGREYAIAIERLDRNGHNIFEFRGEPSAEQIAEVRITRTRSLPLPRDRVAHRVTETSERILPDGRHHVHEEKRQLVFQRGSDVPLSKATEGVRDEILPAKNVLILPAR